MKNFIQPGDVLNLVAPYNRLSGEGALVGGIFGVAGIDVLSTVSADFAVRGVFNLTKVGSQAWTQGQRIFWDDANKRCTSVGAAGPMIGVAQAAVGSGAGVVLGPVLLTPGAGGGELTGAEAAIADLVDNGGGAAADGTIGVITVPTALTGAGSGTANGALEAEGTLATAGGNTYSDAAVNTILAKIENNITELVAFQTAANTALTAARDAIKELSTKQNALLASLRLAGIILP